MFTKTIAMALAALALAQQGALAVDATTQVLSFDIYDTAACDSTKTSIPYLSAGQCNFLGQALSYKPSCGASAGITVYNTPNCTGTAASTISLACTPGQSIGGQSIPAFGYSCKEFPTNKLVTVIISTAPCTGSGDVDLNAPPSISMTFVLDDCLRLPGSASSSQSFKTTLASSGAISMSLYNGGTCSGAAVSTFTGTLDGGCTDNTASGAGRLLGSSTGVKFTTAVPGAKVAAGSSATTAMLNAMVAGLFAVMAAFAVLN